MEMLLSNLTKGNTDEQDQAQVKQISSEHDATGPASKDHVSDQDTVFKVPF
jgi:hypothetical protein